MFIRYGYKMSFTFAQTTPVVTMLDIHPDRVNDVVNETFFETAPFVQSTAGFDFLGNRIRRFIVPQGPFTIALQGVIEDNGFYDPVVPDAQEISITDLPADALFYLAGSRYCETDKLSQMAWDMFGKGPAGWARVQAICDYAHDRLAFGYEHARNTRTAAEAHFERQGVCRDFAHLAVALCRAMNIPARYVNGYLGDIRVPYDPAPMDFSAWFEAYLGGRWHTFDARHNKPRIGRIVVARGRDAADVPMINSFGLHEMTLFRVIGEEAASPFLGDIQPSAPAETRMSGQAGF